MFSELWLSNLARQPNAKMNKLVGKTLNNSEYVPGSNPSDQFAYDSVILIFYGFFQCDHIWQFIGLWASF